MDILELIENIRAKRDVQESQEKLYAATREALLKPIERRISRRVQSRLDAEDVLHESFLRSMEALDLFQASEGDAYFAWVYTIAKHLISDQAKRRSAVAFVLAKGKNEKGPRASQIVARTRRPESWLLRHEQMERLLGRLRPEEAEVIRLHRLELLTFAEIAERLGKTPGAVQRSFSRSWAKLCELSGTDVD
jgi:RNA polymerase sigma-70 factor (ECF subfamily)